MTRCLLILALIYPVLCVSAATTLPIGPITFSSNADYDSNFKESGLFNRIFRSPNGYLEVSGAPTGTAAFDTSATGGASGSGSTGGSDANNDLANFTISADGSSSVAGGIGIAFLLRMNSSEAGGYLAGVRTLGTTAVQFSIYEGAGLNTAGTQIYGVTVPLSGLTVAANTFYPFKVTITGGTFSLNFGSGAAATSFTDSTVSATTGQVGIVLSTISPSAATRLDNFAVVPEPSVSLLFLGGLGCLLFQFARTRPNHNS